MESELKSLVCIGGSAGAGKSTLASALADHFRVKRASFSDALREDAWDQGIPPTRANLQDLGIARIQAGWSPFVEAVTMRIGWPPPCPAVIEGVRHPEAIRECRRQAGTLPVLFVYLEATEDVRDQRIGARARGRDPARPAIDAHEVEREIAHLRSLADLVLKGGSVQEWLRQLSAAAGS